jgi:site-specific recombinase XerD
MERLIDDFISSLRRRDTTKETYRKALREFSRWLGGAPPEKLSPDDIQRYKDYILSKNLSPTSMSAYLTAVRRFYDHLVFKGTAAENPARKIKGAARPERHLTPPLARTELDALLSAVDASSPLGKRDLGILSLIALAGLSEIEIVRADLGDVTRK